MSQYKYKVGVVTNVGLDPLLQLQKAAFLQNMDLIQVPTRLIELSDFASSDFINSVNDLDAIYYRTGLLDTGLEALAYKLNKLSIPLINASTDTIGLHKKSQQSLLANRHNIKQPKTIYSKNNNYRAISSCLGKTFVVKPDIGSKGKGVSIIDSEINFSNYFKINNRNDVCIFQELITDAQEYRVYTVAGKSIAVYKKTPGQDDFRANLHVGGKISSVEPKNKKVLMDFGSLVATKFKIDIAGIDILLKDNECLLLEINQQPGWRKLEELTGINFPDETIKHIVNRIK